MTETSILEAHEPPPNRFWQVLEGIVILIFLGMLAAMFVQVVSRYALGIGVPWTDETARFLYIGQIFLGAAIAQRHGAHIRVTLLLDLLPPAVSRIVASLADLLLLLTALALLVGTYEMTLRTSNVKASTLPITMAAIYAVQGLGIGLYTLLVARDLIRRLTGSQAQ
ncbi:TRAP-type C4-dicarboxylate transport system permease small subunit [Limimaricola soesokkakensis]|uniref:TRAP transporter small permease protein n=1 Tax=Limimaricola soesokkakensis TaxID=1343159 RepID=A0A1X6YTC0_9RHOB|nr:TRAP transporter small permease [Limimaricola soesokkakensis]PSK87542.1 TRAP-type C4-dicarboxylate transport system permease small subunit [Limimaricola soesokkakensis]SLN30903.1 2,3-diketo-L-gulonate TRAP transporter small permease protein YiaM [Limimaricola soesokkakensis]